MTEYQKLVGKLIYLSVTRPDISYVVHYLRQHMHATLQPHFRVSLRVRRYLKHVQGTSIQFNWGEKLNLYAFVYIFVITWFSGKVKNKPPFLGLQLKLSVGA